MPLSEHIKHLLRGAIVSPMFIVFGSLVVFSLGMLFGLGYLRYYVDGDSINRRAIHSTLILNLWEDPEFLPGELNLLKGNQEATISEDGRTMILSRMFSRDNTDLFISEKTTDGWSKPVALSSFVNSGYEERGPQLSRDGKWLLFQSNRPDTRGGFDLYLSQRVDGRWSEPVNLGDKINTEYDEGYACFSPFGDRIFFSSNRPKPEEVAVDDGNPDWDLYEAEALVPGNPESDLLPYYGEARYLPRVNSDSDEMHVAMPSGGDLIYFSSDREGGVGGYDIWVSRYFRGEFIEPENLGKPINSNMDEYYPALADRGNQLVFVSNVYSIHPRALKYYVSESKQVLSKFDYVLLRNVLLIVLLLVIAGVAIHYLLKFLLDSELKLLPRCLIASFLLHLILAALTGSLFITSKIEETISSNLQEMTVNMNALTQESIAIAIRESVAALPQVQAPQTLERVEVEVPLETETPVENQVNPYPDRVSVNQTAVASERMTQVRQAPSRISPANTMRQVAALNFSNPNLQMESPQGVTQAGEGEELDPRPYEQPEQPPQPRVVEYDMEADAFEPPSQIESPTSDTITEVVQSESIANASRRQVSGNLSQEISRGVRESLSDERLLDISSSSPTSVAFDRQEGMFIFDTNFVLEVVKNEDEEEEEFDFRKFLSAVAGRTASDRRFGYDEVIARVDVDAGSGQIGELHSFDRFKKVEKDDKKNKLSGVSDLLKSRIPGLIMEEDSELEIPEYMLEDAENSSVVPAF